MPWARILLLCLLLKTSRPLIRVLVINDNVYGLTISFEMMSIGWSMDVWGFIVIMQRFGDDMQSMSSRQRYIVGLSHFTGHKGV